MTAEQMGMLDELLHMWVEKCRKEAEAASIIQGHL